MGCFNQSCFLSRLDIKAGDKCLIIPVVKQQRKHDYDDLNAGAARIAAPFCLPIFGEYNDYGSIVKIRKDENTALLEKYFGLPIESIVECITNRKDEYGSYSNVQKFFGTPNAKVFIEDLAKFGFVTAKDGTVNHPHLKHAQAQAAANEYAPNHAKGLYRIFWRDDKLVLIGNQLNDKETVWKSGEDLTTHNGFLSTVHSLFEMYAKHSRFYYSPYIFGIPDDKQVKVQTLLELKPCFARKDIWFAFAKKTQSIKNSHRRMQLKWDKNATDYEAKYKTEAVEAIKEWQASTIRVQERLKLPIEEQRALYQKDRDDTAAWLKLPDDVRKNTPQPLSVQDFRMVDSENVLHSSGHYVFRYAGLHRAGREFMEIYGLHLLEPAIAKLFETFHLVQRGMITANIMYLDNHSLEQHGDMDDQTQLMKCMLEVGLRAAKERSKDY